MRPFHYGFIVTLLMCASCRTVPPPLTDESPRVRFLLTFDDGPSIRQDYNPTLAIIHQLATNDVQPNIKAIFFVQTEHRKGGGTPQGREIIRYTHQQGHVIGVHSTSTRGHVAHTTLPSDVLTRELLQAKDVIRTFTGADPRLVRPPYGTCDHRTRTIYADLLLDILMADIRARDGLIYGYKASLWRRRHIYNALRTIRKTADPRDITTVILNFHDVNPYTARHMTDYLHILVEEAGQAGFRLADKPFYDSSEEIIQIAGRRKVPPPADPLHLQAQVGVEQGAHQTAVAPGAVYCF